MTKKLVLKPSPPDGGCGWLICFGCSLITLCLRSVDPSFGLLFGDLLKDLKIDSTGVSMIMGILDATINFSGLFIGFLMKKYSYRKIAFVGSILNSTGLILTSQANSLTYIILTYSILGGLGSGLGLAASFVAMNSFFVKKRGQALGFSMAGTTLGMMIMPQLVHFLLRIYGFRGTTLIIGGLSLNALAGVAVLRPVPLKLVEEDDESSENLKSSSSSTIKVPEEESKDTEPLLNKSGKHFVEISLEQVDKMEKNLEFESPFETTSASSSYLKKIKDFLGFDLLSNMTFLNIMVGLSLFYVADTNFKLFTPFFLTSIGMTNKEVAFCLSLTAFMDIMARLILPTICEKLGYKKRSIFWVSALCIGLGRSVFAEGTSQTFILVVLVAIGLLRGASVINLNLTISECCSLEDLPHAYGIFMMFKGTMVIFMSPIIGYVRDIANSYNICIHLMTGLSLLSFLIWGIEFLYKSMKLRRERRRIISGVKITYSTFL